jgi:cellulose synthase/poly-beta-1,6-N-acetylglucosamine synthase-like glycosyltransferase
VALAWFFSHEQRVTEKEIEELKDEDLPIYTVLVPMYKEPEVAQKIARTVTQLNYPLEKLDVKLLLEEDDVPTRAKIDEVFDQLPKCVEVIVCPKVSSHEPRTKPRACNHGLAKARGKYLVIFDAEDQPENDQLKKSIVVFQRLEKAGKSRVACLQAKLNYFNARQNALTRFFTLEYTNWFDLYLPGLHALWAPIPLGGTSNHFRTDILQQVGGWDPFNVTEDCDLGMRLARRGYSTEVLDSTTWEEANCRIGNWTRQRSRWIKGYVQTHLVHSRESYVPTLLLAVGFYMLCRVLNSDLQKPDLRPELIPYVKALWWIAAASCLTAAVSALGTLGLRFKRWMKREGERPLGFYHAMTFRFTVGGLSLMLLLNLLFWAMTGTYLLREPIAHALPGPIARIKVDDTTNLKEALLDWKLYYTNVVDEERYSNVTIWNTASSYLKKGGITAAQARERISAIDSWSLVSQLFFPAAFMLFFANFIFVALGMISCFKRKLPDLIPFALLVPIYWVLISIAAVKGFKQLFTNPWYWEKTQHGFASTPPQPPQDKPPEPPQNKPSGPEALVSNEALTSATGQ